MFAGVGGQVGGGEAVMTGNEVDRRRSAASWLGGEEVCGTAQPGGHLLHAGFPVARPVDRIGQPELPDRVAEGIVPLAEGHTELAGAPPLIADIPRLHDEFQVAQQHVAAQGVQEGVMLGEVAVETCKRGGQVEAEAVDADPFGPVPQAVDGEGHDMRVGKVKRVAAAGGVFQPAGIVALVPVVGQLVQPSPAYGRPVGTAFACVVVDHIHDDFESGLVQGSDHVDDFLANRARA